MINLSIKTNFFEGSTAQDYGEQELTTQWGALVGSGVSKMTDFLITAQSPAILGVYVAPGIGFVSIPDGTFKRDYFVISDATVNLAVTSNTSGLPRIDAVVLNVDNVNKITSIEVVMGMPAAAPVAPAPGTNQILLGTIYVGNNVTAINSANISNKQTVASFLIGSQSGASSALANLYAYKNIGGAL